MRNERFIPVRKMIEILGITKTTIHEWNHRKDYPVKLVKEFGKTGRLGVYISDLSKWRKFRPQIGRPAQNERKNSK